MQEPGTNPPLTVLVVDSKTASRQHIVALLQACNYKVTSCRTGRECVQLLSERPPQLSHAPGQPPEPGGGPTSQQERAGFDLVLKDHEPPLVDACRLLRRLARDVNLRSIPVVVMSRQDDRDAVMRCLQLGAIDYLIKPLRRNELLNIWTRVWWRRMLTGLASSSGGPSSNQQTSIVFPGLPAQDGITYSTDSKETYCGDEQDPASKEGSAPVGNGNNNSRELEVKTQHGSNNANGSGQENGNSGSKNGNANGNGFSTSHNAVAGSGNAPADGALRLAHAAVYLDPLHGSDQGQTTNNGHGSNQGVEGGGSGGGGGSGEGENENGNGSGNGGTGNSTVQSQQKEGAQGGQEVSEVPTSRPSQPKADQNAQGDYRPNVLQSNGRSSGNGTGQLSGNKRPHADLGPHAGAPARAEKATRHSRPPLADNAHHKTATPPAQQAPHTTPHVHKPSPLQPPAAKQKAAVPRVPETAPQGAPGGSLPVSSAAMLPHGMSGGSGTASATPMFWPGPTGVPAGAPPATGPHVMQAQQQAEAAQTMYQQQQLQHMQQQLQLQQQQGEQQAAAAAAVQVAAAQQAAAAQRSGNPFLLYRPPLLPPLPPAYWEQQRMAEHQRWLQRSYAAAQADSRSHSDGTAVHAAAAAAAAQMQEQQRQQMQQNMQQGYPPAGYPYAAFMQFPMGMAGLGMWPPPWGPGNPYNSATSEPPPGAKGSHNGLDSHPAVGKTGHTHRLAVSSARDSPQDETTSKKAGSSRTAVGMEGPAGALGASESMSAQERRAQALTKFKEKKRNLNYGKKIRYETRKQLAEARPRVKGQFVKRVQPPAEADTATNAAPAVPIPGPTGPPPIPRGPSLHGPSRLGPKADADERDAVAALRAIGGPPAQQNIDEQMAEEPEDDDEALDAEARAVERQEGPWEGPQGPAGPLDASLKSMDAEPVAPAAPAHEDGAVWQYDDRRDDQAETAAPKEGTDEANGKDATVSKCVARSVQGSVGVGALAQGPHAVSTGAHGAQPAAYPTSISYGVDSNHAGAPAVPTNTNGNDKTKSAQAEGSNGRCHGSDSGSNSPERGANGVQRP